MKTTLRKISFDCTSRQIAPDDNSAGVSRSRSVHDSIIGDGDFRGKKLSLKLELTLI